MLQRSDCLLRAISRNDLDLVLEWRNSERIRSMMFSDNVILKADHMAWYKRIEAGKSNSKHMVFEYKGNPIGVINITQIDIVLNRCYWGFYIGKDDNPKGCGLAMGILGLEYIFEVLNVRKLCSEAFAYNIASVNYHMKLGFNKEGYFKAHVLKQGKFEDLICLAHFDSTWAEIKRKLFLYCFGDA